MLEEMADQEAEQVQVQLHRVEQVCLAKDTRVLLD
jgi:hypothetical protein